MFFRAKPFSCVLPTVGSTSDPGPYFRCKGEQLTRASRRDLRRKRLASLAPSIAQVSGGERQVSRPAVGRDVVPTGADMAAVEVTDGMVCQKHVQPARPGNWYTGSALATSTGRTAIWTKCPAQPTAMTTFRFKLSCVSPNWIRLLASFDVPNCIPSGTTDAISSVGQLQTSRPGSRGLGLSNGRRRLPLRGPEPIAILELSGDRGQLRSHRGARSFACSDTRHFEHGAIVG